MNRKMKRKRHHLALAITGAFLILWAGGCATDTAGKKGPGSEPAEASATNAADRITQIRIEETADGEAVLIDTAGDVTYTSISQPGQPGVFFYFPDVELDALNAVRYLTGHKIIDTVRTTVLEEPTATVRMQIDLRESAGYEVTRKDGSMQISFLAPVAAAPAAEMEKTPEAPKPELTQTGIVNLKSITSEKSDTDVRINIQADGAISNYKSFALSKPARIVFDLYEVDSPHKKEVNVPVNSPYVKRVRHYGSSEKLRVVVDTYPQFLKNYTARTVEDGLAVTVGPDVMAAPAASAEKPMPVAAKPPAAAEITPAPAASESEPMTAKAEPVVEKPADMTAESEPAAKAPEVAEQMTEPAAKTASQPKPPAAPTPAVKPPAPAKPAGIKRTAAPRPAWVNRIDFTSEAAGRSTITIGTTRPVEYSARKTAAKRLEIRLQNTNLPDYRKRPLITTRFNSAVDRVSPVQTEEMKNTSVIAVELRESVPYRVEQEGNLLMVSLEASSIPPKPFEAASLPAWKKVLVETEAGEIEAAQAPSKPAPAAEAQAQAGKPAAAPAETIPAAAPAATDLLAPRPKVYTGEKIALDFYKTDVTNVFRILREVSGQNFAIDRDVKGEVTLTFEKPVPWDQVLDLVLKMNQLGMVMEGDIIRIATLATLKREADQRQAKLQAEREAEKARQELEPLITEYIPVSYSSAQSEVLPHLKPILTPNRGQISVDVRNNQLIITDTREKIEQARRVVQEIDKVTPQVIIESRIVEASTSFTKALGIEWDIAGGITDPPIEGSEGVPGFGPQRGFDVLGGTYGWDSTMNFPAAGATSSIGFTFTRLLGTPLVLNARLSALETQGEGRIISSPKIVTLDNKQAKIKQGVEVPYLERDDAGGSSVKFKEIDLLLEVTPHVTPDSRISMKINITKNEVGRFFQGVPSVNTNEAVTELLVNDGDTIVIAGIIKNNLNAEESGWPIARSIPLLGWLFKNTEDRNESQELLIFITPQIVKLEERDMQL